MAIGTAGRTARLRTRERQPGEGIPVLGTLLSPAQARGPSDPVRTGWVRGARTTEALTDGKLCCTWNTESL